MACEKILTVVLKSLIKLNEKAILNNLKTQRLKPMYRITFVPSTTLAKVNQVRFVENVKIYWENAQDHTTQKNARNHLKPHQPVQTVKEITRLITSNAQPSYLI